MQVKMHFMYHPFEAQLYATYKEELNHIRELLLMSSP